MCGLTLVLGENARARVQRAMSRIAHRGPDDQHCWSSPDARVALGFVRLAVNDESLAGRQPYEAHGHVGAFNGEIYNANELIQRHNIDYEGDCDTHILLPLFHRLGPGILAELDGFYSGVFFQPKDENLWLIRDHIGKKPLFYGETKGQLFVTSELKSFSTLDWFRQVPLGLSKLNKRTGQLTQVAKHRLSSHPTRPLFSAMERAVRKRLPDRPCGLFLSGGLDSSIVAALAHPHRKDIRYYVLGEDDSPDVQRVAHLRRHLGLRHVRQVPLPSREELPDLLEQVVYSTESYNPSIVSNGLATFLLAREARRDNLKVVLTGEGADEFFAGYHQQLSAPEWAIHRANLIRDMRFTELRRLDACSMAHGVEARCPFLDPEVRHITDQFEHHEFYHRGANKVALRDTFGSLLPAAIAERRKTSFDVGSGVRALVVTHLTSGGESEKAALQAIWKRHFPYDPEDPYFHSYPTFDEAIARRGGKHRVDTAR